MLTYSNHPKPFDPSVQGDADIQNFYNSLLTGAGGDPPKVPQGGWDGDGSPMTQRFDGRLDLTG